MKEKFVGINKAETEVFGQLNNLKCLVERFKNSIDDKTIPCVFISYQRKGEEYAASIAKYIMSKGVDVYFDLDDEKLKDQLSNPSNVTKSITKALAESSHMLVVISPTTFLSPWVPFEVGYAYDSMSINMKILRHKGIPRQGIPDYLKTKTILYTFGDLKSFIQSIRKPMINEALEKSYSLNEFESVSNPLSQYLES